MSSRSCARRTIATLTGALVLGIAVAPAAFGAQTITVGSTADTVDASPGNGVCEAPCTLRAAVQTADSALSPGADTIIVPAGTYDLVISGLDGAVPNPAVGDLDVTDALTLSGAGEASTTIDGKSVDRIFDVATTASISGVTITGGLAKDGAFTTAGGAIRVGRHDGPGVEAHGTLTLSDSTLRNSSAQDGSGVATDSAASELTLSGVSVLDNTAAAGSSEGGGVNERFGGTVTITSSLIRGNTANAGGGIVDDGGGVITITDSTITENHVPVSSGEGGGVFETGGGTVTITRSTVSRNTGGAGAGVVEDGAGTVNIVDSTIRENVAGGTFPDGGGVLQDANGTVNIEGSLIAANSARSGAGIESVGGGTIDIVNSTISGNHATSRGGAIQAAGGGAMTLTNVTVRDNTADAGAADLDNCVSVPGLCGPTSTAMTVRSTIIASGGVNCTGAITSGGHNIDGGSSCGLAGAGDLVNTNPLLGPLADNGGSTLTHAELAGSPAIDHGDPATCPPTDQRGVARPGGAACDIGAFEVVGAAAPAPPPTVPPVVTPISKPATPKASDLITFPSNRACVSRRNFRIRIRKFKGVTVVSATVTVNGKRVQVVRGVRLRAPVDLRGLPSGRFTVQIKVKTSAGKTITGKRTYRTCAVKRRVKAKHKL